LIIGSLTYLNDPTLADAIMDCIIHGSHSLELKGESMQKTKPFTPLRTDEVKINLPELRVHYRWNRQKMMLDAP